MSLCIAKYDPGYSTVLQFKYMRYHIHTGYTHLDFPCTLYVYCTIIKYMSYYEYTGAPVLIYLAPSVYSNIIKYLSYYVYTEAARFDLPCPL